MKAARELYDLYSADVFRFALYLCGERALAEDITSEAFVRVWTARGPIQAATAKGYLLTIARNLYRRELRRRGRVGEAEPAWLASLPARDASPEQQAALKEEAVATLQLLGELPEIDRTALLLRAVEGMEYSEIAGFLELSLTSVKVKIHRARLHLAPARRSV
jgi:RNA polymerase sigma-70 factor (ECF subfamily)